MRCLVSAVDAADLFLFLPIDFPNLLLSSIADCLGANVDADAAFCAADADADAVVADDDCCCCFALK